MARDRLSDDEASIENLIETAYNAILEAQCKYLANTRGARIRPLVHDCPACGLRDIDRNGLCTSCYRSLCRYGLPPERDAWIKYVRGCSEWCPPPREDKKEKADRGPWAVKTSDNTKATDCAVI
jgi:hypothetical protein